MWNKPLLYPIYICFWILLTPGLFGCTGSPGETDPGEDAGTSSDVGSDAGGDAGSETGLDVESDSEGDAGPDATICEEGQTDCGGVCVDTDVDVDHCGVCDRSCEPPANATATCEEGSCSVGCDEGFELCDELCVDTSSDPGHCSGCNEPCGDEFAACYESQCVECTVDADCPAGPCGDDNTCLCDPAGVPFGAGSGSPTDPFLICSADQLNRVAGFAALHFSLVEDIELDPAETFNRIGVEYDAPFSGHFQGNGHTVANLNIEFPDANGVGLFGYVGATGIVENVILEDASAQGIIVGSLAGYNFGTIRNCHATGDVVGTDDRTGGLVGTNREGSKLEHSSFAGTVEGGNRIAGGLVGWNSGEIHSSQSSASVDIEGTEAGGLVAINTSGALIRDSHSTGDVTGERFVGGLVGINSGDSDIDESWSSSNVSGDDDVGGLVGQLASGAVSKSYATGLVEGDDNVGGLVGATDRDFHLVTPPAARDISSSYSTATVMATGSNVGGLVGNHRRGAIRDSYATGSTSGGSIVGGLVGRNHPTDEDFTGHTVISSYSTGSVSDAPDSGGLVGSSASPDLVDASYWDSQASGTTTSDGGTPRQTTEFSESGNFPTWDFDTTWQIGTAPDAVTRPILQWQ